jgi:hypothetical protein
MKTEPTPAEAARDAYYYRDGFKYRGQPGTEWDRAAKAAIDANLAQVKEGLPNELEVQSAEDFRGLDGVCELYTERFAKLESERDSLKSAFDAIDNLNDRLKVERNMLKLDKVHAIEEHEEMMKIAVDALEFYGPQGDFDLADYELKCAVDSGDIAREAITKLKGTNQ